MVSRSVIPDIRLPETSPYRLPTMSCRPWYMDTRAWPGNIRPNQIFGNISAKDVCMFRSMCAEAVAGARTDGARTCKEAGPVKMASSAAGQAGKENGSNHAS